MALHISGWNGDRCRRCNVGLIPQAAWAPASKATRSALKRAGYARTNGRGLCAACHQAVRVGDEDLRHYSSSRDGLTAESFRSDCIRCGVPNRQVGDLCLDCADVTADLSERDRWLQPA